MKKLLFTLTIALASLSVFSQTQYSFGQAHSYWNTSGCEKCAENVFTFDKLTITALEKYAKYSDDYDVNTPEKKTKAIIALIYKNMNDSIAESSIKLSVIPPPDKFILIGENKEFKLTLVQNLKTKKFYVLITKSFNYMDYSRHGADGYGFAELIKIVPKVPSPEEAELLSRYKSLIKSANTNTVVLQSIQRKCLTRGFFDDSKVKGIDKQTYNKNLSALKVKANKLDEIDRYEDKDGKARHKLTTSEIASLTDINNWNMNFYTID